MKESLVDQLKILLPPLQIKFIIMMQFVKVLPKDGPFFMYLCDKFKYLSDAKLKEDIFVGPEISKFIQDEKFEKIMNKTEENAMKSFKEVVKHFVGNRKKTRL